MYKYLRKGQEQVKKRETVEPSKRTRGNCTNLQTGKSIKRVFCESDLADWQRFPRQIVVFTALDIFNIQLNFILSNLF